MNDQGMKKKVLFGDFLEITMHAKFHSLAKLSRWELFIYFFSEGKKSDMR